MSQCLLWPEALAILGRIDERIGQICQSDLATVEPLQEIEVRSVRITREEAVITRDDLGFVQ